MAATTRIALILEYDGTRYYGLQLQASLPTIQGEVEKALWKLTGKRIRPVAASRTDAGVHARAQVVSFKTESPHSPQVFVSGLNYYLPGDIAVKAAYRVSESFNVRRSAISREYDYYILNSLTRSPINKDFSYLVRGHLNIDAMNQASRALIGEHDFASFTSGNGVGIKNKVRRVYQAEMRKDGKLTVFNIVANSFLPHQVRNTVGALIRVGLDKMTVGEFHCIIEAKKPGQAGPTAPACGLCLTRINYSSPLGEEI